MNLTKGQLKYSLVQGFFPSELPKGLFSTKNVSKYLKEEFLYEIENKFKSKEARATPCALFSIYKSETERRILGIPHILTYLLLCACILDNIEVIYKKISSNINSGSKNIFKPYEELEAFEENLKRNVCTSIGNKYILTLDISKCYENIYTHSITWALLGKDKAKQEYIKRSKERSKEYNKYDELDKKVRKINNDETKGIPIGPITSRLISELILAEIDENLKKEKVKWNRFVDDYKFYFNDREEVVRFIEKFQRIIYEFKLSLNTFKTKIEIFPDGLFEIDLKAELSKFDFKKYGTVSFIKKIMEMHSRGIKGAFSYGMKVLSSEIIIMDEDKEFILSCLINSLIIYPKISEIVIDIFEKNDLLNEKNNNIVTEIFNDVLEKNIKNNCEEEIVWNIYFMMKFDLKIAENNILQILNKYEVFSTILILDYIKNKNLEKNSEIIKSKDILKKKLQKESIYGTKWLLIYEANINLWLIGIKKVLKQDKILSKMYEEGVKFYHSIYSHKRIDNDIYMNT